MVGRDDRDAAGRAQRGDDPAQTLSSVSTAVIVAGDAAGVTDHVRVREVADDDLVPP